MTTALYAITKLDDDKLTAARNDGNHSCRRLLRNRGAVWLSSDVRAWTKADPFCRAVVAPGWFLDTMIFVYRERNPCYAAKLSAFSECSLC
jgi:hypothetical protein